MSNPRHSEAYTGKRDKLISRERILEKYKASKCFDPEKSVISRMISAFPLPPTRPPKAAHKPNISSPTLLESSHPITTQSDTAVHILKKDVPARPCDDAKGKALPAGNVYENKHISGSSDATYTGCKGTLVRQWDDFESEVSLLKTVEQRSDVSADYCDADDQSLFDDNESFYADEVSTLPDEMFLNIPNIRDRRSSQSSSVTACSTLRRDSSTPTLCTELTNDFKRVPSASSLYECPALSYMPSSHGRRSSSSTHTSLSSSSLSTCHLQSHPFPHHRHTTSYPLTPTWSTHNSYSEYSVSSYFGSQWLDDSVYVWAADDTVTELSGTQRQDAKLMGKTLGTARRGGTKRASSYQGPTKKALQRQDTLASIRDRYTYEREETPAIPDLPLVVVVGRRG